MSFNIDFCPTQLHASGLFVYDYLPSMQSPYERPKYIAHGHQTQVASTKHVIPHQDGGLRHQHSLILTEKLGMTALLDDNIKFLQ